MGKRGFPPLLLLLFATMALAACQLLPSGDEAPPTPVPTTFVLVDGWTRVPANRTGGLLDTIIIVEEPSATVALDRIASGEIDLYAATVSDPQLFERIRASAELGYNLSYGDYTELTFNPAGPLFTSTGQLNPFASMKIREAMNYLVDRDYIAREIYGGLAIPRFTAITISMPDSARMADTIRALEEKYAYNPKKAGEIIDAELTSWGATFVGDQWMYNGQPITLTFLIRVEAEPRAIGDYVADRLESIGFAVDRRYKSGAEVRQIMAEGPWTDQWNLSTGVWMDTSIRRNLGSSFSFFYTPPGQQVRSMPPWPIDDFRRGEFEEAQRKLFIKDFKDMQERTRLFQRALVLSLEDSTRVFLVDQVTFTPYRSGVSVAADLSAPGGEDSALWALTLRRGEEKGGSMTVALPSLLSGPWNGLAGSDQVADELPQQATAGAGVLLDPYTGLYWPQRVEKAKVVVQAGLPVTKTLDWLTLESADLIEVPGDVWADWDPVSQKFITAGDRYTETQTALVKVTVYYPAGMYQAVKWHDGSPLSAADFVLNMILTVDRARPESALYDSSTVDDGFPSAIKGIHIVSVDPLVIETFTDLWYLDAEPIVSDFTWWPQYGHGEQPWHTLALGILAESDRQLAFSQDKAAELGVEQTGYVSGPGLDILKDYLVRAHDALWIPYAPTLQQFVGPDEVASRYDNLAEWARVRNHLWVGPGPYYLDSVFTAERTLLLTRFLDYPDPADKWLRFAQPRLAAASVSGPDRVSSGQEVTFDVAVNFQNRPYPVADVQEVKYTVWNAEDQVAGTGQAEAMADGLWRIWLDAGTTGRLGAGLCWLDVTVIPGGVGVPAFASFRFAAVR